MTRPLKLGTRSSALAVAQAQLVADALAALEPGRDAVELVTVQTRGDRDLTLPLREAGADFFSGELDEALRAGRVDFCVHSLKDLPPEPPAGIVRAALPARGDPRDVVVFRADVPARLAAGETLHIGSSSVRRERNVADFLAIGLPSGRVPGRESRLRFEPLRGAVDARLGRLTVARGTPGALDGVVLALAGLDRLARGPVGRRALEELAGRVRFMVLPLSRCPAAAGQGVLAIECRADDVVTRERLAALHDAGTEAAVALERDALAALPAALREAAGATAVDHPALGPVCFVRAHAEAMHEALVWNAPPGPSGAVRAFDGIAWQRACTRRPRTVSERLAPGGAVFVAYWHAATGLELPDDARIWVSGVESWRQLASRGLWIEGCGDNLGFEAIRPTLMSPALGLPPLADWTALSYGAAIAGWRDSGIGTVLASYDIEPPDEATVTRLRNEAAAATDCYWSSPEQFRAVGGELPSDIRHACGAGKTLAALRAAGVDAIPFPNGREWRRWLG